MGNASAVQLADGALTRGAAAIGLSKVPHKCHMFGTPQPRPRYHPAPQDAQPRGGHCSRWLPDRHPVFVTQASQRHTATVHVVLGALRTLPLGHQDQFLLLRRSLVPRLLPSQQPRNSAVLASTAPATSASTLPSQPPCPLPRPQT
jgi:hypothetical protein